MDRTDFAVIPEVDESWLTPTFTGSVENILA